MLNVSDEVKALFKNNYRQVARICMTHPGELGQQWITEADIIQGGLTIDKYCTLNGGLDIGTFVAGQLKLKLKNTNDKFRSWKFLNAELTVEIGIKKWDAYEWENAQVHYIPMGVYVVNTPVQSNSGVITITAMDRAVYFDPKLTSLIPNTVTTVGGLIEYVCGLAGVTIASGVSTMSYYDSAIDVSLITRAITLRTVIQQMAFVLGAVAYMDNDGYLTFKVYKTGFGSLDFTITSSDRYELDIDTSRKYILGGSQVEREDGSVEKNILWGWPALPPYYDESWWVVSSGEYLDHVGVEIRNEVTSAGVYYVNTLYNCQLFDGESFPPLHYDVTKREAYPCRSKIKSMPWIELLDYCRMQARGPYDIYVTHMTYTMNGPMYISCDLDPEILNNIGTYIPSAPGIVI